MRLSMTGLLMALAMGACDIPEPDLAEREAWEAKKAEERNDAERKAPSSSPAP